MEYRFFYPINETKFNTKWKTKSNIEKRTDIYFILPEVSTDNLHIEYGLKLRNKKKLELKIREKRFSNGQEIWFKPIHSYKTIPIDDMESIIKVLKKSNETKLIERLISSQSIILCYVSKYREQTKALKNCTQELTGLHLQYIRSNDQHQIGNDLFYETACIEQSNSELIDEKIIEKFSQEQETIHMDPMGYPEFLFRIYQQIINDREESIL